MYKVFLYAFRLVVVSLAILVNFVAFAIGVKSRELTTSVIFWANASSWHHQLLINVFVYVPTFAVIYGLCYYGRWLWRGAQSD